MTALIFIGVLLVEVLCGAVVWYAFGSRPFVVVYAFGVLALIAIGWAMHTYDGNGRR